jgi:DNA invertase Pin-like site-specific DNA recombinase
MAIDVDDPGTLEMTLKPDGARIGYIRVSTLSQSLERQLEIVGECRKVFQDKESGSTVTRQGLQDMLDYIREGDHVVVSEVDRLARSEADLANIVQEITQKGCSIEFVKDNLRFSDSNDDPTGKLILHVLSAIGAFSRRLMLQRQAQGIAKAQDRGVKFGRPPKADPANILQFFLHNPEFTISKLAKKYNVSRSTAFRAVQHSEEYRKRRGLSPSEKMQRKKDD